MFSYRHRAGLASLIWWTYQWIRPEDWVVIVCRRGSGVIALERPQSEVFRWWWRAQRENLAGEGRLDSVWKPNTSHSYLGPFSNQNLNPSGCLAGESRRCEITSVIYLSVIAFGGSTGWVPNSGQDSPSLRVKNNPVMLRKPCFQPLKL